VCLDKRFFDNRYMTGALCAKKRCNNATSLELPSQQQNQSNGGQQNMKRSFDATGQANYDYVIAKRRPMEMQQPMQVPQNGMAMQPQQRVMTMAGPMPNGDNNGYPPQQHAIMGNTIRIVPHQPMQPGQHMNLLVPMTSMGNDINGQQPNQQNQPQVVEVMPINKEPQQSQNGNPTVVTVPHSMGIQSLPPQPQNGVYTHYVQTDMMGQMQNNGMHPQFAYVPSQKVFTYPKYEPKYEYYECDPNRSPHQDPYVPPSYSADVVKNGGIVLQPL